MLTVLKGNRVLCRSNFQHMNAYSTSRIGSIWISSNSVSSYQSQSSSIFTSTTRFFCSFFYSNLVIVSMYLSRLWIRFSLLWVRDFMVLMNSGLFCQISYVMLPWSLFYLTISPVPWGLLSSSIWCLASGGISSNYESHQSKSATKITLSFFKFSSSANLFLIESKYALQCLWSITWSLLII